ncbi:sensor histidine kinase [Massilia niabensis]|uniref:Sensor histidine kinase n=1 Tax=Massilia niabensis TaxID=544910 RepID=A0ABW0L7U3_9BURK
MWETSSALVATFLLLAKRRLDPHSSTPATSPWRWFAWQARWLPFYWIAFVPLVFGIRHGVYALAGAQYGHGPWSEVFVYESMKLTVFIGLFTVIAFGLASYRELLETRVRAERANALLRDAQLARLAQQMQPHFLFNALNTISSLMHSHPARAEATLVDLAGVLRATLALGERHQATLSDELHLARGYAAVMAARFEDRVSIDWQVDEDTLPLMLPAVSLQPLLENVFKHTVERRRGPTRIRVSARRVPGALLLRVEDDAGVLAPAVLNNGPGIGLSNLRQRLASLYGDAAQLTLSQPGATGVRAELRIPCVS